MKSIEQFTTKVPDFKGFIHFKSLISSACWAKYLLKTLVPLKGLRSFWSSLTPSLMYLHEHCVPGSKIWNPLACSMQKGLHRNDNNNNILYSSQQEIKAVVRSHNEEHISISLSHETHSIESRHVVGLANVDYLSLENLRVGAVKGLSPSFIRGSTVALCQRW